MQQVTALLGIGAAIAVGAASPGPSFVMVARTAIALSRPDGLYAALGMGIGGLVFAMAALLGLQGLLLAIPSLYWALKVIGGLYLAYLGLRIWVGAKKSLSSSPTEPTSSTSNAFQSFALGLTTQISNPKTAVVYASVFAAFLPAESSLLFSFSVAGLVFLIETVWYTLVALILSANVPRQVYLHYKAWIDRLAGGMMIALGFKLAASARQS
ncbi:MAG: LysE family translocator [Leptolyngbya sp. SIOISBB]|nr:LysE family translocator [Leptolyngbya sp. SIOISBB]